MGIKPLNENHGFLLKLNSDLEKAKGKSVYLKIEGTGSERHVKVVKDGFATFIAKIACFFHVKVYDLREISSVFEQQLSRLESTFNQTSALSLKSELSSTGIGLADIFIDELSPSTESHKIANTFWKKERKDEVAEKISELKSHFLPTTKPKTPYLAPPPPVSLNVTPAKAVEKPLSLPPKAPEPKPKPPEPKPPQPKPHVSKPAGEVYDISFLFALESDEALTAVQEAPQEEQSVLKAAHSVMKEVLDLDLPEEADKLADFLQGEPFDVKTAHFRGQLDRLVKEDPRSQDVFKAGPEHQGSLAWGVFSIINNTLQHNLEELQQGRHVALQEYASYLVEAQMVIGTFTAPDGDPLKQLQCKRALLLLELRSLLLKTEVLVLPKKEQELAGTPELERVVQVKKALGALWEQMAAGTPFTSKMKGISQERLESVTDSDLSALKMAVKTTLEPLRDLWQGDVKYEGVTCYPYAMLESELTEHFQKVRKFEENIASSYHLERLEEEKGRYKEGSLSLAVYEFVKKGFRDYRAQEEPDITTLLPTCRQAQYLLDARGIASQDPARIEQAKRAYVCLELKAFVEKARKELKRMQIVTKRPVDDIIKTLQKKLDGVNLDSVTKDDLQNLQRLLFDTIGSLPTKDKLRVRLKWPHYAKLLRECKNHMLDLS